MTNVVIVNSPLFRNPDTQVNEDYLPPLGLGYIATSLQRNNITVELIDSVALNISLENLLSRVRKVKPAYLGINIFSANYFIVKDFIEAIDFKVHIIIGGLATQSLYNEITKWKTINNIDIVIGDGELIILDIVRNKVEQDVLYTSNNKQVFKVGPDSPYFVEDISTCKLNRDFFARKPTINHYGDAEISIISSRGCIYNCAFCAAARSLNKEYPIRERSTESLIEELSEIKEKYPETKSIRILDDLFLKSAKTFSEAVDIFKEFDFTWRSMAHIRTFNNIPQKAINDIHESGCIELFIGIESGAPNILKTINKTHDINLIKNNLTKIFKAGINVKGYFICGFPNETKEDLEKTYNLARELKNLSNKLGSTFRTSVFQFRPYHGTLIYESLKEKHPDFNIFDLSHNTELSSLVGRSEYNFHSINFSKVSLSTIHDYICKINII
jgi:radical SAM superfamily enzyme YgiQ (UPF0313 family)